MLASLAIAAAALSAEVVCETPRDEGPEGASSLTRIEGDRYYCVDDRGGWLHEVTFAVGDGDMADAEPRGVAEERLRVSPHREAGDLKAGSSGRQQPEGGLAYRAR